MREAISIIIPLFNERENIPILGRELKKTCEYSFKNYEVIFINDSSTDDSELEIDRLLPVMPIKKINNKKRVGQGLSIHYGICKAKYDIIIIIDGDCQFDVQDILTIYDSWVNTKSDFVCTRRIDRKDGNISKNLPSRAGNYFINLCFNTYFSDIGSSLKIAQKKHLKKIPPFKNYHRYINIFLYIQDLKFIEIPVVHKERTYGVSKYGSLKFIQVIYELFIVRRSIGIIQRERD